MNDFTGIIFLWIFIYIIVSFGQISDKGYCENEGLRCYFNIMLDGEKEIK